MGVHSRIQYIRKSCSTTDKGIGTIASIIAILEFAYWHWNYMSDNLITIMFAAGAIFNFIAMLRFAYKGAMWKSEHERLSESERTHFDQIEAYLISELEWTINYYTDELSKRNSTFYYAPALPKATYQMDHHPFDYETPSEARIHNNRLLIRAKKEYQYIK